MEREKEVPPGEPLCWITEQAVPVADGVASADLPPRTVSVIEVPLTRPAEQR